MCRRISFRLYNEIRRSLHMGTWYWGSSWSRRSLKLYCSSKSRLFLTHFKFYQRDVMWNESYNLFRRIRFSVRLWMQSIWANRSWAWIAFISSCSFKSDSYMSNSSCSRRKTFIDFTLKWINIRFWIEWTQRARNKFLKDNDCIQRDSISCSYTSLINSSRLWSLSFNFDESSTLHLGFISSCSIANSINDEHSKRQMCQNLTWGLIRSCN